MKRRVFRAHRSAAPPIATINVAGLLSVLATLFCIYAISESRHRWTPAVPSASSASIQPDPYDGDLFTIDAAGALYVGRRPIDRGELDERVRISCQPSMRFFGTNDALYLEADPELPYATVLEVMERCRAFGGDRVVLVTETNLTLLDAWASGRMPSPSEWRSELEEAERFWSH